MCKQTKIQNATTKKNEVKTEQKLFKVEEIL